MKVEIEPTSAGKSEFTVKLKRNGQTDQMGTISFDTKEQQWKAKGSIVRCLEFLTSNHEWRQGNLGNDYQKALLIVLEVLGAWYLLTRDSVAQKPVWIHKLDVPVGQEPNDSVDLYKDFRPLSEGQLNVG